MQDTELYCQLLGVSSPWTVDRVELNLTECAVYVYLVDEPNAMWLCPECGQPSPVYDHREARTTKTSPLPPIVRFPFEWAFLPHIPRKTVMRA